MQGKCNAAHVLSFNLRFLFLASTETYTFHDEITSDITCHEQHPSVTRFPSVEGTHLPADLLVTPCSLTDINAADRPITRVNLLFALSPNTAIERSRCC